MTRTVVALYDNFQDANAAVRELVDSGFIRDDISLMAGDQSGEYSRYLGNKTSEAPVDAETASSASQGAGVGASIGAALGGIGGLLIGLGALAIPGIGPVIAAGPLAAALTGLAGAGAGALAGGVTGGLIGALVDAGVPEETAQYYSEGIRRGGTLLTVKAEDSMSGTAVNIMNRHNPVDINSRASQWHSEGWTGLDSRADEGMPEPTGTVRSAVDTNLENTDERYGVDQNIPTTGDRDQTYGTGGIVGSGSGYGGSNLPDRGEFGGGMTNRDTGDSRENYSKPGSYGDQYGTTGGREGEMHHTYNESKSNPDFDVSASRGQDGSLAGRMPSDEMNTGSMRGQDESITNRQSTLGSSGTDYDSTRMMGERDFHTSDTNLASTTRDYTFYDTDFRNHFNNMYGSSTYSYDQYQPAYRYGYDIATDPRYTGRTWDDVEPETRQYWDEREPGAWDRIKDSILYAWNSIRNTVD